MDQAAFAAILCYIDAHLDEPLRVERLAALAGYSPYHFCRQFSKAAGLPPIAYVTRRRLERALEDVARGEKILDTAVKYGFETEGGFSKAFKRQFGFPPSLYALRVRGSAPSQGKEVHFMHPHLIELAPFTVAGRTVRQTIANIARTADIPVHWAHTGVNPNALLQGTSALFPASHHCEISMCYDVDLQTGAFTYLLGRSVDTPEDAANIPPDMARVVISGLYAIFQTEPTQEEGAYLQVIRDTWREILLSWLPQSEFEVDETRRDFEYYDLRDHGWYFGGKRQMDIFLPVRPRPEYARDALPMW
jgi:AraC family transcriptional regulator